MTGERTVLLALLCAAGACSFDSSPGVPTIENFCADGGGCPEGICEANICIDASGRTVSVAIEVLRGAADSSESTPASWAFEPAPYASSSTRDLDLPVTRLVRGQVRWDGLPVPAKLRFVRRMNGSIAELTPVPVDADTLPEPIDGTGDEAYDFSAVLVAGETYDVVVSPTSDMVVGPAQQTMSAVRTLPPLYFELAVEPDASSDPLRFDVSFPVDLLLPCTDDRTIGCTLQAEVASSDGEMLIPEAGLQVRAIDPADGRVVSSIAETNELGEFAIRVSEETQDYLIRVTSSPGGEPFPAVSVDPKIAFSDDPLEKRIEIPRLSPIQLSGEVRDRIGRIVPGATVRCTSTGIFDSSELGLAGTFNATTTSTEDGSFQVEVLPGVYEVIVTPPSDVENDWGILFTQVPAVEMQATTGTLAVPWQINLGGDVKTFKDERAAGLTILARARESGDDGSVHRSEEAVSDDSGEFAMSIDVGLYDMHVKVPSESGYAWLVEPEVVMSLDRGDLTRNYRLAPPIPVYGVVRTSLGEPVANARIRGFLVDSYAGGAARPLQIAETTTAEDGSYRLLIAPRLGDE